MINEIATFVDSLKPQHFTRNLELKEGLYILLDLDENGDIKNYQKEVYNKKSDPNSPFFDRCLQIQVNSIPIAPSKIFNPNKKIYGQSCTPFGVAFNKKNFFENKVQKSKSILKGELQQYLKLASNYVLNENHKNWFDRFKKFASSHLLDFILNLEEFKKLKTSAGVFIYLNQPSIEDYKETHQLYLKNKVFNKDEYNKKVNGKTYGISDSLSSFQPKKVFLRHQTAPLELNYRVSGDMAMKVWKFFQLVQNKQLPNPIPIFIDKEELNNEVVKIFHDEGEGRISFAEIIKSLIEKNKTELQNYYLNFLIYDKDKKKYVLADVDFVPQFRYYLEPAVKIKNLFPPFVGESESTSIGNIFQLESKVFNPILDYQLIGTKEGAKWLNYFNDLEPKYFTENTFQQILNYRKGIYDYVYKSQKHAFNASMFHDILRKGILEDIRLDEPKDQRYTKNQGKIKQKLNIWLNLYNYFTNAENKIDMVQTTKELKEKLEAIANENESHIDKKADQDADRLFAFASGQLINRILLQSESSNKSHAMLEPFLQKSDPGLFKNEIAKTFETYKHNFKLYPKKYEFDKVMSEVMGFDPGKINMKDYLPFILAGYFSESVFQKNKS